MIHLATKEKNLYNQFDWSKPCAIHTNKSIEHIRTSYRLGLAYLRIEYFFSIIEKWSQRICVKYASYEFFASFDKLSFYGNNVVLQKCWDVF